ncbi:hypothetical protein [Rhizobium leguminosarum]|uniref:hypothetical protein n=1 Tax=Rhizobium leguminosarum TaxID=384 RepID=UPI001FD8A5BC|nr:hypothetical protein [Rhizobium leguminosarum]
MAAPQRLDRHVEHGKVIGHEEGVEFRPLQRLREGLQMGEIEIGVRIRTGIAPGTGMQANGTHEGAEAQLPWGHDFPHGSGKAAACPALGVLSEAAAATHRISVT